MSQPTMSPVLTDRCWQAARNLWRCAKPAGEPAKWDELPSHVRNYWFGVAVGTYWLLMEGSYSPPADGARLKKEGQ